MSIIIRIRNTSRFYWIYLALWFKLFLKQPKQIKYLPTWLRENNKKVILKNDVKPWLTYSFIDWFEKKGFKQLKIFEWGSGGSSIYFSNFAKEIVSVEHDNEWFCKVQKFIKGHKLNKNKIILQKPQALNESSRKRNKPLFSASKEYFGLDFYNYCHEIDNWSDLYFDLIIIDGRAREACLNQAISKLTNNGILVFDNSDSCKYVNIFKTLESWGRIDFFGPGPYSYRFTQTSIFVKKNVR